MFLGFLPIMVGDFDDISTEWYGVVGKTISLTLAMNIVTPHISKLMKPLLKLIMRWRDRGWKMNMKKTEDGKECMNTRMEL